MDVCIVDPATATAGGTRGDWRNLGVRAQHRSRLLESTRGDGANVRRVLRGRPRAVSANRRSGVSAGRIVRDGPDQGIDHHPRSQLSPARLGGSGRRAAASSQSRGAAFTIDEGCRPQLVLLHEVMRGYKPGDSADLFRSARQIVAAKFDLELHTLVLVRTGSLPRATSGKIQRGEASRRFESGALQVVESFVSPTSTEIPSLQASPNPSRHAGVTDIRAWLVARLARQCRRSPDTIDVAEPFASFGLDSVTMVSIAGELEKWLDRPLPQTLLYDSPTIARLRKTWRTRMKHAISQRSLKLAGRLCRAVHRRRLRRAVPPRMQRRRRNRSRSSAWAAVSRRPTIPRSFGDSCAGPLRDRRCPHRTLAECPP